MRRSWRRAAVARRAVRIHEHRRQGHVRRQLGPGGDELPGDVAGPGDERRVVHDHESVDLRGRSEYADSPAVVLGRGAGDHVDRVGHARLRREHRPQTRRRQLVELRHDKTVRLAGVCGEDARAAPVCQDGHPRSSEAPLRAQHRGEVEHLLDGLGTDNARLVEHGVYRDVALGEGGGVRGGPASAGDRAACLHRHDRHAPDDAARIRTKRAGSWIAPGRAGSIRSRGRHPSS